MILKIPVFTAEEAKEISEKLLAAEWINGKETAGLMGVKAKNNQQLSAENPVRIELGKIVLERLVATPLFMHAALPLSLSGINFNRYENGEQYGWHADNSFQGDVRADLSATLFLSDDYEGGELCFEDQKIKFKAGELVLYTSGQVHCVNPVNKGVRLAAFFWIQSLIKDHEQRKILFDINQESLKNESVPLRSVYQKLMRMWR
jgi:PKHD-type hydroxylase